MRTLRLVPALAVLLLSFAACAAPAPVKVGEKAPDFTLPSTDGTKVTLSKLLAKGPVILAFYPKAFTMGCTRELTAYTAKYDEVKKRGAEVLAISLDDLETLEKFKAELGAPFPFLSDADGAVAKRYAGLSGTVSQRVTVIVDPKGTITTVSEGMSAIDPDDEIASCPMAAPAAPLPASK